MECARSEHPGAPTPRPSVSIAWVLWIRSGACTLVGINKIHADGVLDRKVSDCRYPGTGEECGSNYPDSHNRVMCWEDATSCFDLIISSEDLCKAGLLLATQSSAMTT